MKPWPKCEASKETVNNFKNAISSQMKMYYLMEYYQTRKGFTYFITVRLISKAGFYPEKNLRIAVT